MSGVGAAGVTGSISGQLYGPMTQIIDNAAATLARLNTLTEQSSTGLVSQTYAGLGAGAAQTVLSVAPQVASANAQIAAINATTGPMTVQQNALTAISSITTGIVSQLSGLGTLDSSGAAGVIAATQAALVQVATLLDTQDGGTYVFGGQDSGEPPVPNPDTIAGSGFYTQIQAAVAGLAGNGAAATTAAVLGVAGSNAAGTTPFAAGLAAAAGLPTLTLGNGQQVTTGIAANSNGFVTTPGAGATSTGSYMRDILAGLASIASLTPAQIGGAGFQSFLQTTETSMRNANDSLNQDAGVLGNTQAALATQATGLGATVTALTNQVSNADTVDAAATISQISSVQTALQSSYQLIATMKTLNLASYL
jgi:flagellar hook-associated protein 3 FlgL